MGFVSPEEAVSGFSNTALITIMGLMILSASLERTGVIQSLANQIIKIIKYPIWLGIPLIMLITGSISAFISTTAVVIIFIKLMPEVIGKSGKDLRMFMIPISFAGILGGSITMMGTSTNLIVKDIYFRITGDQIAFFQFSVPALILFALALFLLPLVTILYFKFQKKEEPQDLPERNKFTFEMELDEKSPLIGKVYFNTELYKNLNVELLGIKRGSFTIKKPAFYHAFRPGDLLILRSSVDDIMDLKDSGKLGSVVNEAVEKSYKTDSKIVELLILPNSPLVGKKMRNISQFDIKGGIPLGLKKHGNLVQNQYNMSGFNDRIDVGDKLVVELLEDAEENWFAENSMELLDLYHYQNVPKSKKVISGLVALGVVLVAAFGILTILKSVLIGLALLLLFNCISFEEAYKSISWQVIFLLAWLLPIGAALKNTETDSLLSNFILRELSGEENSMVITAIFGLTMLISGVINNNATAIILTPIAILIGQQLEMPLLPLMACISFAANYSFFTPIGYQTNTLIYGLGIYKFRDFLVIGGVMSLVLWFVASKIIPLVLGAGG
jgi:di/tricarboxylate transporter